MHIHAHARTHMHAHVCTCMHMHAHVCTHTHTYTHTHAAWQAHCDEQLVTLRQRFVRRAETLVTHTCTHTYVYICAHINMHHLSGSSAAPRSSLSRWRRRRPSHCTLHTGGGTGPGTSAAGRSCSCGGGGDGAALARGPHGGAARGIHRRGAQAGERRLAVHHLHAYWLTG